MNACLQAELIVWGLAYIIAVVGSGPVVRTIIRMAGSDIPVEEVSPGRVIGKLEDILVVSLVLLEAYTALAIVFTATSWRVQNGRDDPTFYVLGTLANFTWALHVALAARGLIFILMQNGP